MGNLQAAAYAELVTEGVVDLRMAVAAHLSSNHYPPVHQAFVPSALEAIEAANAGQWEKVLHLPNAKDLTVTDVVEDLHLAAFLSEGDQEEGP